MSGHPLHAASCSSRTYPWSCPECTSKVFVYECTCGSWVMFDELGGSWPQHACFDKQYQQLRAKVLPILTAGADPRSATFQPFRDLKSRLGPLSTSSSEPGQPETASSREAAVPRQTVLPAVKRMDPIQGEKVSFIGVIREYQAGTSRMKELYATLGVLGRKLFGLPAERNAVQLTIVDTGGAPRESYSAIGDKSAMGSGLGVGVMVWVEMLGHVTPSASAWVIREIHAL